MKWAKRIFFKREKIEERWRSTVKRMAKVGAAAYWPKKKVEIEFHKLCFLSVSACLPVMAAQSDQNGHDREGENQQR